MDRVERLEREVHTGFAQVDARFDRLEAAIRADNAATRRHFEVVAEGLEHKITAHLLKCRLLSVR